MTYYSGFVAAVPTAEKDAYIAHCRDAWRILSRHGALRQVECWGADVPHGKKTDFHRATQAGPDETPTFSWVEWPDKATCDAAWQQMMDDPDMAAMTMPFDGKRVFFGGFDPIFHFGASQPGRYVQGFVLAVPADRKQAYADMAASAEQMFRDHGASFMIETWGNDVPHGQLTDFYRATQAEDGEVPVFSWIEWPDRATCDDAARRMQDDMAGQEMPEMPFDGSRMFWAGFQPVFDERSH